MNKRRDHKSASPHGVAALGSIMVLVVGLAVGAYFVEFRGLGLQTLMSGVRAPEIFALFGGLVVCTLVTQFMVAGAARKPASQDNVRDMVRAVLTLDPNDPNAMRGLQSVPELHELAMMIAAEKSAKIEATQQLHAQRREIASLLKGMERSSVTGDPLREEQGNEICNQLVGFWNSMLGNKPGSSSASASGSIMQGPGSPEPGMVNLDEASAFAIPMATDAMAQRVERVEESLETLQNMVQQFSKLSSAAPHGPQTSASSLSSEQNVSSLFAPEPEEEHDSTRPVELGAISESEPKREPTSSPSAFHEWNGAPASDVSAEPAPATHGVEPLSGLESSALHDTPRLPGMGDETSGLGKMPKLDAAPASEPQDGPFATSSLPESSAPSFAAPAQPPAFSEAAPQPAPTPAFGREPAGVGQNAAANDNVSFGVAPTSPSPAKHGELPGMSKPAVPKASSTPSESEVDREFAQHFPHFVGQPVSGQDPQIEVTYGDARQSTQAAPAPTAHASQTSPTSKPQAPPSPPSPQATSQPPATPRPQTPRSQLQAGQQTPQGPAAPKHNEPTHPGTAAPLPAAPAAAGGRKQFPESQIIDLRSLGAVEFED